MPSALLVQAACSAPPDGSSAPARLLGAEWASGALSGVTCRAAVAERRLPESLLSRQVLCTEVGKGPEDVAGRELGQAPLGPFHGHSQPAHSSCHATLGAATTQSLQRRGSAGTKAAVAPPPALSLSLWQTSQAGFPETLPLCRQSMRRSHHFSLLLCTTAAEKTRDAPCSSFDAEFRPEFTGGSKREIDGVLGTGQGLFLEHFAAKAPVGGDPEPEITPSCSSPAAGDCR